MSQAGTYIADNGEVYVDKKRHMWLMSLIIPAMGVAGPLLYMHYGNEFFIWMFFLMPMACSLFSTTCWAKTPATLPSRSYHNWKTTSIIA